MKLLQLTIIMMIASFASNAHAYSVRCNKKQTSCQIKTKRVTVGDYIGVFGENNYLQAVGKVTKITGARRTFKITKKYSLITQDSDARIISDKEASRPRKYFKIARKEDKHVLAVAGGIAQVGVGDGFMGFNLELQYAYSYTEKVFFLLKGNYISGSGVATDNLAEIGETTVSFSAFGLTGGVAFQILQNAPVSIRFGADVGFANVSVATGEGEPKDVLRGRADNGIGLEARGSIAAILRTGWRVEPFAEFDYLLIQGAQNTIVMLGLRGSL